MGGALPPRQLRDERSVLDEVRIRHGAIGYVSASSIGSQLEGLRVLGIFSGGAVRAPAEAGYPIHVEE
jgi:hypothetical protein